MKTLVLLFAALFVICPTVHAAKKGGSGDKKDKSREQLSAAKEKYREAIKEYMEPKDKNKDGSLSRDEFTAGESDAESANKSFDEFDKNRDRYLSKDEIGEMIGADKEYEKVKDSIEEAKRKKKKK